MKLMLTLMLALAVAGCDLASSPAKATTGVTKATAKVSVQANGLTIEQENVQRRLQEDNRPGSLKHLYVISAMSGDVVLYSTVKGKITSSGKRLSPYTIDTDTSRINDGFPVHIGGSTYTTGEVLQDDGTYGSSIEYIYWWDSKGVYHQHYVTGGQIVHVANAPMRVGRVIINVDADVE